MEPIEKLPAYVQIPEGRHFRFREGEGKGKGEGEGEGEGGHPERALAFLE